jgi:YidC/Oxa1 family membrane protein insertase
VWNTLIQGFVLALIWLYQAMGSSEWSLVLSITVLTIAVRLITLPLTLPSQRAMKKNAAKMQALQPELDKLKKKYAKEPQKLQEAQLHLYQEHGINPLSSLTGCLPLVIQLPIIWAFYQSISRALGLNLARPDLIVLPILVAASTWLQQKLGMPAAQAAADPQAAQMTQSMNITMPLMFGFFAMQMPAGLSIYFIVSNLVGIGIQWVTNRWLNGSTESQPKLPAPPASASTQSDANSASKRNKGAYKKRGYKKRS